jgi:hypothetical protein
VNQAAKIGANKDFHICIISALPFLPPDLYDDFVTWICERYDRESFVRSTMNFKKRCLKQFLKECTDEQLQFSLTL